MTHTITALRLQKKNPQRVNVYLDGEFAFGLSRIVVAWLQVGQELSDEKIAALQSEDAGEAAYQRALKFLDYRDRSTREVQENLKSHGVSEEVAAGVLERLGRNGLLDDQRFARLWVENRSEFRPRSRWALRRELRQKGIAEEAIEEALAEIQPDEELACQAARKQLRKLQGLEWPDFRQKMGAFLARRGFSYDVVAAAVKQVWEEQRSNRPSGSSLSSEEVLA